MISLRSGLRRRVQGCTAVFAVRGVAAGILVSGLFFWRASGQCRVVASETRSSYQLKCVRPALPIPRSPFLKSTFCVKIKTHRLTTALLLPLNCSPCTISIKPPQPHISTTNPILHHACRRLPSSTVNSGQGQPAIEAELHEYQQLCPRLEAPDRRQGSCKEGI